MRVVVSDEYEAALERGVSEAEATIATNLQYRRDTSGMKLWEIGAALGGMDLGNLSRYLTGKRSLSLPLLVKLGTVFGVDPRDWMLPPKDFKKAYPAGDARPFEVAVVPTSSPRSSSRSTAASRNARERGLSAVNRFSVVHKNVAA